MEIEGDIDAVIANLNDPDTYQAWLAGEDERRYWIDNACRVGGSMLPVIELP